MAELEKPKRRAPRKPSQQLLKAAFLRDVRRAWDSHGVHALKALALDDPASFCKLVAQLCPPDVEEGLGRSGVTVQIVNYSEADGNQDPQRSYEPKRLMAS